MDFKIQALPRMDCPKLEDKVANSLFLISSYLLSSTYTSLSGCPKSKIADLKSKIPSMSSITQILLFVISPHPTFSPIKQQ